MSWNSKILEREKSEKSGKKSNGKKKLTPLKKDKYKRSFLSDY